MPLLTKAKQRTVISALRDSNVRDIEQNYNEPAKLWCNEKWITAACLRCSDQRCIRYIDAEISCGSFSDFPYERNLNVCPVDAIKWNFEKELPEIENGKCIGCGLCAARCPVGAIFKADNKMKVSAPESDDYIDLPINYENLVKHKFFVQEVDKIYWNHQFQKESDRIMEEIYEKISHYDGRSMVPNVLVRNLIIALNHECAISRAGDIYTRMDAVYSSKIKPKCSGVVEIEFGRDTLEASRGILDDIAVIYCTADKRSYDYFIDHDGNVFGDMIEFDGTHGLSAYNKTDQEKYEGSDSTFISPKYVQTIESKPVSEWIIAVGRHEGFIPSEQWVEVQELLDAIAEKYNRPHRKTNALLAGLVHCPHCGRRLSVISESDRWTNGKPRFKYVCPGYRKKECNFKAVDGVLLDEFVVQQLSDLSDENSERFKDILEIKIEEVLEKSQTVQEHTFVKKKRDKLKADIAAQTRNLREADGSIKKFIQEDLQNLAEELRKTERQLSKLDEGRKNNMIAIRDLEMTKERLLSFAEYAKDAQPEVLVTLIQTIVERIYIVDKDDERYCHIFIKGCSGEDYTGFFRTAGYIEDNSTSVCDSEQCCICRILLLNMI